MITAQSIASNLGALERHLKTVEMVLVCKISVTFKSAETEKKNHIVNTIRKNGKTILDAKFS